MEQTDPRARRRPFLLEHPDFGLFWCARGASALAMQIQAVAVGWQVYDLTHSTFQLGMVGLAQFLPMVLLTFPAGHAADRYDRPRVAAAALVLQAALLGALALGSRGGWLTIPVIFSLLVLIGSVRSFERPASQAMLAGLVPPASFPTAIAWSSTSFQLAAVAGPALGGVLYAFGPVIPYAAAAGLALLAGCLLAFITTAQGAGVRRPPGLETVLSGLHFIRRRPVILGSISLDLFAVLLGGATALLPAFARDILGVGAVGLGALRAAPALGSLAVSAVLLRHPIREKMGRRMFGAVFLFGLATVVFGLSRSAILSFAALAVIGGADIVSVVVRSTLVQLGTPDEMRGRVSAVNSLFIGTSNQLGEFESGVTAALLGTVPATILGGLGTVAVGLLWIRMFPGLAALDRPGGAGGEPG